VSEKKIGFVDFHVHTIHSNCGKPGMTARRALGRFSELGYLRVGFTDHYDPLLTTEKARQTRNEVEETNPGLEVWVGSEVCVYLPGWPRAKLKRDRERELDFCILSPSHHPNSKEAASFSRLPVEVQRARIMDSFIEAVETEFADAIAHPFAYERSQIPLRDKALGGIDWTDLEWALEVARRNSIAIEFSPRVLTLPEDFLLNFYRLCKNNRLKFSLGSDAHRVESIGAEKALFPLMRKIGVTDSEIWTPEDNA